MRKAKLHLKVAESLAKLLDSEFSIFNFKFGLDPIIGLVPIFGDLLSLAFSLYIYWIAVKLKLPRKYLYQILRNIAIDFLIGLVPYAGDLGDFFYKANMKNIAIIKAQLSDFEDAQIIE